MARPTIFNKKLGSNICKRIAEGESLRTIVKDEDMPSASSICRWLLDEDKKEFWEQYEKARNVQAELMFDELLEIADDGTNDWVEKQYADKVVEVIDSEHIQRSRLRVDTRKWYLSKVLPKKFGDKIDLTSLGEQVAVGGFNFLKNENNNADDSANG
jgi:hypothetical protein